MVLCFKARVPVRTAVTVECLQISCIEMLWVADPVVVNYLMSSYDWTASESDRNKCGPHRGTIVAT